MAFDISKPGVRAISSTFGGGWALPINEEGKDALRDFYGEDASPLPIWVGEALGYVVEPQDSADLSEHLRAAGVAWTIEPR